MVAQMLEVMYSFVLNILLNGNKLNLFIISNNIQNIPYYHLSYIVTYNLYFENMSKHSLIIAQNL